MSVKHTIVDALMLLILASFPLQWVIDPSVVNIASACIVASSSMVLLGYIKWSAAADDQPLSTLALFGFCITTQLGALLVQTGAWTPLRFSLYDPLYTFGTLAFYQAIALSMHAIYRYFTSGTSRRVGVLRGLLNWAGVYRVPPSTGLWFMGGIGVASFLFSSHDGVLARVASGFNFLAWAPFLLPIYIREIGPEYCNARRNRILLGAYTGVVVIIGIALNVRVIMFIGVVTVVLLYLLVGLRTRTPVAGKSIMRIALVAVLLLPLSFPLSDLATAMAIARGSRGKVSPVEMVKRTVSVWRRPALIEEYRHERSAVSRFAVYDEGYIANTLLARFVETKFHDNALHFAAALTTEAAKEQLRKVTVAATWAALPTPMLKVLGIDVDKEDLNYSIGDYLAYLSRGVPLGGRKTGSMFAQGMAIMGPLFPILYAGICLFLYGLMDLLSIRNSSRSANLSALAMMTLWTYFYRGVTADALSNVFVFIFRSFGQNVLIYLAVFSIARIFIALVLPHGTRDAPPGWQRAA